MASSLKPLLGSLKNGIKKISDSKKYSQTKLDCLMARDWKIGF